jgi:HK97 family phage prohead protease
MNFESIDTKEDKYLFSGYASLFNNIDHQNDVIIKDSFEKEGLNDFYPLLWQHDKTKPIGKIIKIFEDKNGLYVTCEINLKLSLGKEVAEMIDDKIMNYLSIGYTPLEYDYSSSTLSMDRIRSIKRIKLWEVSVVTFPANQSAKIFQQKSNLNPKFDENLLKIQKLSYLMNKENE